MLGFAIRRILIASLVALGAAALYLPQLRDAPFYLGRDEMFFGLVAHSLAATGHDPNGLFLPLYIQSPMRYGSEMWFQPMLMYSAAASVKLFGLDEGTIRLPMALAGIVDIVLIYFIGRRLFHREVPAIAAAVLLAWTPAHFIHARVAMDFQAPLPFTLAWLLCVVSYLETRRPAWLFGAGLGLGIGVYTYIAAYMLMPIYGMLTFAVLFQAREPAKRYGLLLAGALIPALVCVPFLIAHPTVVRDVLWHYDRTQPLGRPASDLFVTYFGLQRFAHAAWVYAQFWTPRFLFINGPQSMWVAGVFLLPTAGLLIVGIAQLIRRRSAEAILLLGGLFTAPIPASLVGDLDAVHRASMVLPFGVLVAIAGWQSVWTEERPRVRAASFIAIWTVTIGLATGFHAYLPLAQANIRAATIPLVVAGLLALWRYVPDSRVSTGWRLGATAAATLATLQVAYFAFGYAATIWVSTGALAIAAAWLPGTAGERLGRRQWVVTALVAAACSHFMFAYPDYSSIHRMWIVPASAILLTVRFLCSAAAFVAVATVMAGARRAGDSHARPSWMPAAAIVTLLLVQFAYYRIDYFADPRLRLLQALLVLVGMAAAAAALSTHLTRHSLGRLIAVTLLGMASLQFAGFYADYFTRYRDHAGNFDTEGNARVAWETVIERAGQREIPAIYVAQVGPYGFSDLYWQFYAFKHDREDLLPRSIADTAFSPDRVRQLPEGSVAVTSPSPSLDETIDRMMATGELRDKALVTAPDGFSRFWILETGPRH